MNDMMPINEAYVAELELDPEVTALLDGQSSLEEAVARLADNDAHLEALMLLARHMAIPYAIGWAAGCLKSFGAAAGDDAPAIACADEWLAQPDGSHRRRAAAIAEQHDHSTAGAWLAAAVGWSGGSMAPEGQPEVAPPRHLYAVASAAALGMTLAADVETFDERFAECVSRALELAAS